MPTVSVIVPCYNHAPYLRQRMESILGQTWQDFELILLDDCSTDGSADILRGYARHPKVSNLALSRSNSGHPFRQWQKGIAMASGQWVWIAESDDYCDPTFLERMMQAVSRRPECTLAFCATRWVDAGGRDLWPAVAGGGVAVHSGADFVRQRLTPSNGIANVSQCLMRRDACAAARLPIADMRLCGDWLLYTALAAQGQVVELREALNCYRQHRSNSSADAERRGLTFIEGSQVLRHMTGHCGLRPSDYARGWGRAWAQYERRYRFSAEVRRAVRRSLAPFPMIALWHAIYRLKPWHE